ncbi:uncharacterized protein LOC110189222 [Drosophila serrata]|uniref:uncharacterized protein LOC110189222 n=1 Tax=Drosophila serrata TaxID=7274 RepID=UPI000A1D22BB|nr:uncharacterized protein LOC110189222 [Drosophila serrata]KAH8389984.1 hypothetical protein KR200_004811 [Drosophila serrata]
MDLNEISMSMDVKLDTHDKRPVALRYKTWTRCQVKIEAIKCVPCFLRLTFQTSGDASVTPGSHPSAKHPPLSISVNVPGVSLSLATSRTMQHSYGLFWTQNRRDCFIYFALETETSCRRHMKWMRKSIKNLELYRQIFLEQRRLSRGPRGLGPLPNLPETTLDGSNFSTRVSQIYEEIFDGSRISRVSIASGIYEEMKPSVMETPSPPPLPAQPHRKRINTFECSQLGEIPRCSTNPESELAKKKKYKIMLDNLFGSARQKRSDSASEHAQPQDLTALPCNDNAPPTLETALSLKRSSQLSKSQRNSFSSPDLSKLNFLDTFGDELGGQNHESSLELNISLDDSVIEPISRNQLVAQISKQLLQQGGDTGSLESLNVSEQLPYNFNFSACNTSTINLIGSHGAVPENGNLLKKNKIVVDDLTGYCVMAPIIFKPTEKEIPRQPGGSTASTSSGYSTGSYCSSTSSCNTEDPSAAKTLVAQAANESDIYEAMHGSSLNSTVGTTAAAGFAEHLYENLLAVKAAQELEVQPLCFGLSTSTPTESPLAPALPQKASNREKASSSQRQQESQEEEDYYQTPRKSIISVDDKIPSYYPNSCDTLKSKRRSPPNVRHLVSSASKLRRERKENLYISSPHQIIEQRQRFTTNSSSSSAGSLSKSRISSKKTAAAHKISEGVYAVTHSVQRQSNHTHQINNNEGGVEEELLHLTILKNIDFKFDDGQEMLEADDAGQAKARRPAASEAPAKMENRYHAAEQAATKLLQKYATLLSPSKGKALAVDPDPQPMTQSVATSNELQPPAGASSKKFASLPRFKKIDFSPLKIRLNNVLQRNPPSPQQ